MTVREYIAELQKLDQNRNIWTVYDYHYFWETEVPEVVDEETLFRLGDDAEGVVEIGDYFIIAV